MARKIVVIDPVPEGNWYIESTAEALVYKGIGAGSIHIHDAERKIKRWVRDPETGQAIIGEVSVGEFIHITDEPEER